MTERNERIWDRLSPAQADGQACVICGRSVSAPGSVGIPAGRSPTGSPVFACRPGDCAEPGRDGRGQAGFLRELADHLARFELPEVNISSDHAGGWTLQVFTAGAGGLAGWARSLGTDVLDVRDLRTLVAVEFPATLGGRAVRVWAVVDALRAAMELTPGVGARIGTGALAYFAEHAVLPARRALLEGSCPDCGFEGPHTSLAPLGEPDRVECGASGCGASFDRTPPGGPS